jgi:hypothetical protein
MPTSPLYKPFSTRALLASTLAVSLLALVLPRPTVAGAAVAGSPSSYVFAQPAASPDRYVFSLDTTDKRALAAQQRATAKRRQADKSRERQSVYATRIAHIEQLVAEAAESQGTLRVQLEARLVDRYTEGATSADGDDVSYLLAADSMSEAIQRSSIVGRQAEEDAALMRDYELTSERLAELERALEQMRDAEADRTIALEEQADGLDVHVAEASQERIDASAERRQRKGAGHDGTWLIAPEGGFAPQVSMLSSFAATSGAPYNGGARTPERPATSAQINAILAHPQIDVYAGGRIDIAQGHVDGRVVDALLALADRFGGVIVTSLISGHGVYTSSGNVSMHTLGCAVDIGSVSNTIIQSSTQGPGSITEQSVLFLAGLPGDLAPHQVISLNSYGGPTLAMGDHDDHIHLGYSC